MLRSSHYLVGRMTGKSKWCFLSGQLMPPNSFADFSKRAGYCTFSSPVEAESKAKSKSTDAFVKFVDEICAQTTLKIDIPIPYITPKEDRTSPREERSKGRKTPSGRVQQSSRKPFGSRFTKRIAQYVAEEGPYTQTNAGRFTVLVDEIKKAVPEMDAEEVVNTIVSMGGHYNIRDMDTLHLICQRICSGPSLNVNQLAGLSNAIAALSLLHPELISKIKSEFVDNLIHPIEWSQFALTITGLSRLQVGDETFWTKVSQWMETHLESAPTAALQRCVIALAVSNLDFKLLEKSVDKLLTDLKESANPNPRAWLTIVHAIGMVDKLTAGLVESVLNPDFQQKLASHNLKNRLMVTTSVFDKNRLINIAACARYSLKNKVPEGVFQHVLPIDTDVEQYWAVKNSKVTLELVKTFRSDFHKVAPIDKISKAPFLHETGALLDGLVYVDVDQKKFMPLQEVDSADNSNVKQVAVIYLTKNHLTIPEEGCKPRPVRQFPMQFRNLKLAGLHPVVFSEYDFNGTTSEAEKLDFIQEKLLSISDAYQSYQWRKPENENSAT